MNRSTRRLPCHNLLNLEWSFEFSNPEEEEISTIEGSKQAGRPRSGYGGSDPSQGDMMSNTRVYETWMPWMFRRYCTCQKKLSSSFPCYVMWKRTKHASSNVKFREALKAPKPKEVKPAGCRHMRTYIHDNCIYTYPELIQILEGIPGHAGGDEEERELRSWEDTRHSCSCSSAHNLSLSFFRDRPRSLQIAVVVSWGFCLVDMGSMDDHHTVLLDPGHLLPVLTPRNLGSQAGHHQHFNALQLPRHIN